MSSTEMQEASAADDGVSDRALAVWEIASVVSSVLIAEWILSVTLGQSRLMIAVPLALAFLFVFCSQRLRNEGLSDLGLRFDNFLHAGWLLLLPMVLFTVLCVAVGWWSGARVDLMRWHPERFLLGQLVLGFGWGFVQQYVLQSFINRRAQIVWGPGWLSILVVAAIFGALHLPNLLLTVLTFIGGFVWATVYQRAPNLFALALSHSLMTWIAVSTLPPSALNHLRIGFKYFS